MAYEKSIEIIKDAMILERKGYIFYSKLAEDAKDKKLQELFKLLASEETEHFETLKKHYLSLKKDKKFTPLDYAGTSYNPVKEILTDDLIEQLAEVTIETAAISGAYLLEQNSINYYTKCYKEALDEDLKSLFKWLSDWENEHLKILGDIDNAIRKEILNNSKYWQF